MSAKNGRRFTPAVPYSFADQYQYFGDVDVDEDDDVPDAPADGGVIGCELVVAGLLTSPGVGGVVMPYLASTASLHAFCSLGAFASQAARSESRSASFAGSFAFD